jgi:hypothetical protein
MAQTSGLIQRLKWATSTDVLYAFLGPTASATQAFILPFDPGDPGVHASRRTMSVVLARAHAAGLPVTLTHDSARTEIEGVDLRFAQVRVEGIEVTQAIQNLSHAVPLIALKPTVVRVYLSSRLPAAVTVRGVLSVRRAGGTTQTLPSLNTVTLNPTDFGQLNTFRNDAARSLNFRLAPGQTAAGELDVSLSSLTDTATNTSVVFSPPGVLDTFEFTTAAPMRLAVIGFSYQQGAQTFTPTSTDIGLLISWLRRAYPVAQVIASQQVVTSTSTVPFSCGDINAELAAIRALDVSAGVDARTHYYGIVADGGFFMRGCAAIAFSTDPAAVSSGPTGPGSWGWDFDGSYGDWYGGHELGHNFGRLHPGFCGESNDDNSYPFTAGQLANADGSYAGFDVGDAAWGRPLTALPGTVWHDVMTYCNRQWLSSYTYAAIRARLAAEDALGPGAGAGGGAGRPDERYPRGFREAEAEAARTGQVAAERRLVSVVARVNLTRGEGRIAYVNPVAQGEVAVADAGGRATLRALDADGKVISEIPCPVKPLSDAAPDQDQEGLCDVVMPVDPATVAIELWIDDRLADTFRARAAAGEGVERGAAELQVGAVRAAPRRGEGGGVELAWGGRGRRAAGVSYSVQVSRDRGRTWRTVSVGLREPRVTVDAANLPSEGPVLFRVIASDGFRSTESVLEWSPAEGDAGPEG